MVKLVNKILIIYISGGVNLKKTLFFMLSLLFLLTASSCSNSDSNKMASSSEPTKSATSIVSEINSTENISTNSTINDTSNSDTFGNVKVINFSSWKKDSIPNGSMNLIHIIDA
jgi:hypothetical protein